MIPEDTEGAHTGIAWDARQGRSKVLLNLLTAAINSYSVGEHAAWLSSLRGIHWLCFPYTRKEITKPIQEKISLIENNMKIRDLPREYLQGQLYELMDMMMDAYKNQFMQVQDDDDKPFDANDVLGMK